MRTATIERKTRETEIMVRDMVGKIMANGGFDGDMRDNWGLYRAPFKRS